MNKRSFIKNVGVMSAAFSAGFVRLQQAVAAVEHVPAAALAANEEFWRKVRMTTGSSRITSIWKWILLLSSGADIGRPDRPHAGGQL